MDIENLFSKEIQDKIKNKITEYLKKHNFDLDDPVVKKVLDDRMFDILKIALTILLVRKKIMTL